MGWGFLQGKLPHARQQKAKQMMFSDVQVFVRAGNGTTFDCLAREEWDNRIR